MSRFDDLIQSVGLMAPALAIAAIDRELAAGMPVNMTTQVQEEDTPFVDMGAIDVSLLAMCTDAGVARHLLSKGADPNLELESGCATVDFALAQGHFGIVVQLLEGGLAETQDMLLEKTDALVEPKHRKTYKQVVNAYFGTPKQKAEVLEWSLAGGTFRPKQAG